MFVRQPTFTAPRRIYFTNEKPAERVYRLPVDVYATEENLVLTASVPGLRPEDLEITLDDDTLVIRGETNGRNADVHYLMSERFHGKFERRLTINVPVNISAAEATFDNGVLTLVLPKAEEAKPHRITVKAAE
jgi:HSP20 family protein